ncbi:MAG: alpha/beta hydrolase fold domain-containing protein [Verrucomicrobiae bacterium]|nr:alpha/beta hydrolase fold domain-containing protein [Verrucomicrobiae bacterium]
MKNSKNMTDAMQEILDVHATMNPLPIEELTPELARQMPLIDRAAIAVYGRHFTKKALLPLPIPVGKVEHRLIPGSAGNTILIRIYTPNGKAPDEGWPILVYFHGGGWVLGTLDTYDSSCRALCDEANCIVVSVHYRQAPENPWPAAVEDAFAAYQWICAQAHEFHGSVATQIAVGGESAGGNLAAVVAQMARDQGVVMPLHQLLIYPVTDLANGMNSTSAREHAQAKPLNLPMLHWFYNHYVPAGAERTNPYISPLYAEGFIGLAPATIILAEIDPLRSDGKAYAAKLEQADVPVNLKIYEGVTHEFFGLTGLVKEASSALSMAAKDLRRSFNEILVNA